MIVDDPGRPWLFMLLPVHGSEQISSSITAYTKKIDIKDKTIIFEFFVCPEIFTFLDSFNKQEDTFSVAFIKRTGEMLQQIDFKNTTICDDYLDTIVGHSVNIGTFATMTVHLKYKTFEYVPQEPNKDARYLWNKFLKDKGIQ